MEMEMERDKRNGPLTIISDRWTRLGRAHGAANGASNSGHGRVFLTGLGALLVGVRRARQPCRGGGSHAGLLLLLLHGWWVGNPWTHARARTHVPVGWMDNNPGVTCRLKHGEDAPCVRDHGGRMRSVAVRQARKVDWPPLQKIATRH